MALLAARLEARAAENPDDVEARLVLAQVYERGGDFAKATAAYREAIALVGKLGPVPGPLHAALGETLVAADDGRVGREARLDRKSAGTGKRGSDRVDTGGRRTTQKKKHKNQHIH